MGSLARLYMLLLLGSVFLALVSSDSVASWESNENPFLFRSKNFKTRYENERGRIRILPNPYQRSDNSFQWLPRYVEFELKPQSLFLPHHRDAVDLLVVLEGRAIATIVNQTHRETYQLEQGDILKTPPGNLVYTANVEENQRFRAASVLFPINIPGRYENFYPSGNQNPRSYYQAFSEKTLEATFNSNYKEIQKVLFGLQQEGEVQKSSNEGVMVSLSGEQAREMRRQAQLSSSRRRSSSSLLINLRNLQPRYANNHGKLWEACPENFDILRDLDMSVVLLELKKGSLLLPHYNSKAIAAAQIVEGKAKLELASPYMAKERSEGEEEDNKHEKKESEGKERREGQIQGMSTKLNEGDVFVAPAGHPFALRASKNNDLWMVAFLLGAKNNQRNFLGGERDNVINQIDKIVKEQSFGGSAEEIEKLLSNQKESYFVNAQEERTPLSSILEENFF